MRWMDTAWTRQGVCETPGPEATPAIIEMFRDVGASKEASDETAWCAAFVGSCLERSGIKSTGSLRAKSYATFGTEVPLQTLRVGAIAVFNRGPDPAAGHVGFISGWTAATVAILGGNQGDAVTVTHFPRADLVAVRWPEPPVTVAELAAAGSRTATLAVGQVRDAAKGAIALGTSAVATVATPSSWMVPPRVPGHLRDILADATLIKSFGVFALGNIGWVSGCLALWFLGAMAVKAGWIAEARADDQNTGANIGRDPNVAA